MSLVFACLHPPPAPRGCDADGAAFARLRGSRETEPDRAYTLEFNRDRLNIEIGRGDPVIHPRRG